MFFFFYLSFLFWLPAVFCLSCVTQLRLLPSPGCRHSNMSHAQTCQYTLYLSHSFQHWPPGLSPPRAFHITTGCIQSSLMYNLNGTSRNMWDSRGRSTGTLNARSSFIVLHVHVGTERHSINDKHKKIPHFLLSEKPSCVSAVITMTKETM